MSVEEADPPEERVRLVGFREREGPLGETVALNASVPLNPLRLLAVMVDVVVEPCFAVTEDGVAVRLKSPVVVEVTVSEMTVV